MRLLEINLLPIEYRRAKKDYSWLFDRRIVWPTVALFVAISGAFLLFLHIQDTINALQSDLEQVSAQIEKEKPLLDKIRDLDQKLAVIEEKNKALKSIQVSKKRWVILFENISSVLPPNTWLVNLVQDSPHTMEMRGVTHDFAEVAQYMVALEQQVSFQKVSLTSITTQQTEGQDSYAFVLKCEINPELGMEVSK
jgi:Tfp pilus assembly protein PilN